MIPSLVISRELIQEAQNISDQVYHPLTGFLGQSDLASVLAKMRLANGTVWPMPILLDASHADYQRLKSSPAIFLRDPAGHKKFKLNQASFFQYDRQRLAKQLFQTLDSSHPGVKKTLSLKPYFLTGIVQTLNEPGQNNLIRRYHYLTPQETRAAFKQKEWTHIAAFQTRNPPHKSHEYLQKQALTQTDGLLIQPIIGSKKIGDFKNHHIFRSYQLLLQKHYPDRAILFNVLPTFMRYAGPREALFHALIRRNFGCTHMIIGRDHAGVHNFYGSYDAQKIFDQFDPAELKIQVLKYNNAFYCLKKKGMIFEDNCDQNCRRQKQCPKQLSGSYLREQLIQGEKISPYLMRPSIAHYLEQQAADLFLKK